MTTQQKFNSAAAHMDDAGEHIAMARDHVTVGAADALDAGMEAVHEARVAAVASLEKMKGKGRHAVRDAEAFIRSHPLASLGAACATAFVFGKLTRGR